MHILWGILMAAAGLFMLACGTTKSEFVIYRLMVQRSRILWGEGDKVHRFYQVTGTILIILGLLWALGVIWTRRALPSGSPPSPLSVLNSYVTLALLRLESRQYHTFLGHPASRHGCCKIIRKRRRCSRKSVELRQVVPHAKL